MTPYLQFDRNQWAALRDSVPMTLSEDEIARLKGINEDLSLEEVAEIYLPLSRLLNFYISSNLRRQAVLDIILLRDGNGTPAHKGKNCHDQKQPGPGMSPGAMEPDTQTSQ